MSQRAIRKRDNSLNTTGAKNSLFRKSTLPRKTSTATATNSQNTNQTLRKLKEQYKSQSTPELRQPSTLQQVIEDSSFLRSKSDGDLRSVIVNNQTKSEKGLLLNAKSEVCLQSIASHTYDDKDTMRSHRDLTQSAYVTQISDMHTATAPRRMSESSLNYSQNSGGYSQRTGSMFASQLTLSSSGADPNTVLRVPIIGYEVMEERARFTVYKLRVENPVTNDCWLVLRRYTDFVRLNTKLKQAFPNIMLMLPRKKLFGDNFNSVFLDNRVQGLQIFVNSIMVKEELRKFKLVREFFCLDEPPSYSESMEECRAIFEAQEETISHLKLQIQTKNDLILSLQQKLRDEKTDNEQLKEALKNMSLNCSHCSSANHSDAFK